MVGLLICLHLFIERRYRFESCYLTRNLRPFPANNSVDILRSHTLYEREGVREKSNYTLSTSKATIVERAVGSMKLFSYVIGVEYHRSKRAEGGTLNGNEFVYAIDNIRIQQRVHFYERVVSTLPDWINSNMNSDHDPAKKNVLAYSIGICSLADVSYASNYQILQSNAFNTIYIALWIKIKISSITHTHKTLCRYTWLALRQRH